MFKKFFSTIIILSILLFSNIDDAYAQSDNNFTNIVNQNISDSDNLKAKNYYLSNDELNLLREGLIELGYLDKINEEGYKKINNNKLNPVEISSPYGEKALLIPNHYENDTHVLYTQLLYYKNLNIIVNIKSVSINKNTHEQKEFYSFSNTKDVLSLRDSSSFVCKVGGKVACGTFCGGIGLTTKIGGFSCFAICDPAFDEICNN